MTKRALKGRPVLYNIEDTPVFTIEGSRFTSQWMICSLL